MIFRFIFPVWVRGNILLVNINSLFEVEVYGEVFCMSTY